MIRKIFTLWVGYIAWNVVSSLYNEKKGKDLRENIKGKKKNVQMRNVKKNVICWLIILSLHIKTYLKV